MHPLLLLVSCQPLETPDLYDTGSLADPKLLSTEILIDDEDGSPGFTTTGDDWTTWATNGEGFDSSDTSYHYLSHTLGGSDRRGTATWTPEIPTEGTWRVETWFRRTENRTHDADHYVYDGDGNSYWMSIDQEGAGGSGWLSLGEYWCTTGTGGCYVVLDGTDDDESDEANAMRFVLVSEGGDGGGGDETTDCSEDPGAGTHQITFSPTGIYGSGNSDDWTSTGNAKAVDGAEAHTPNVDAGEYLMASDWDACDPVGDETIDAVQIEVLGRMQYDSGTYQLIMGFDGGGSAYTTYSQENSDWVTLDITGDRASWDWADLSAIQAWLTLDSQPGGARDSDAWVDAFRMTVTYTTQDSGGETEDPGDTGSDGEGDDPIDTGAGEDGNGTWEDDGDTGYARWLRDPDGEGAGAAGCGCAQGRPASGWLALALAGLLIRRRRP